MTTDTQQPWPEKFDGKVVFLVDADSLAERQIIARFIANSFEESATNKLLNLPLRSEKAAAKNSKMIHRCVEQGGPQYFLPLRVVWGVSQQPETTKGVAISDYLWGEKDALASFRQNLQQRGWLARKSKQAYQVITGAGASLAALKARARRKAEQEDIPAFIARSAFLALERSERSLKGARYKVPRLVKGEVLGSPHLKARLEQLHDSSGVDYQRLERQAAGCLKEMAATPSPEGLDAVAALGRFMYTRGFDEELDYKKEDLQRVRNLLKNKPVAFVFTHKSHIDGFLLYTLFHDLNLPPVHTFGGINMGFMGLGTMLRNAGAIFIRRSFSNDEVYKAVFKEYIDYLGKKRFPLMWSLEGTRSRTGKLMPPRFGLINYVVSSYLKDDNPDLVIMPVSIVYDQIPEVFDYDALQSGGKKRKESALWFMQYLKGLKNPYGKIHIRFGEGLEVSNYLENQESSDKMSRRDMQKLAFDLAVDVNNATPITVNSLICYVLLEHGHRAISFNQLTREVDTLLDFITLYQFPMTAEANAIDKDVLQRALKQLAITGVIDVAEEALSSLYMIPYNKARIAAYYRNGLIQFFITGAVGELALLAVNHEGDDALKDFHKAALRIRDLMKYEFFFEGSEQFLTLLEKQFDMREPQWREALMGGSEAVHNLLQNMDILIGHGTLRPFLDAYLVFARALSLVPDDQAINNNQLMKECLALGRQGVLQQRIHCEESVSQSYFENAVKIAEGRGLHVVQDQGGESGRLALLKELRELSFSTKFLASVSDTKRHQIFTSVLMERQTGN